VPTQHIAVTTTQNSFLCLGVQGAECPLNPTQALSNGFQLLLLRSGSQLQHVDGFHADVREMVFQLHSKVSVHLLPGYSGS
jgi:hypothetical protein